MQNSVYALHRGINQPMIFKGLKAQYILYMGIGALLLLIAFTLLYVLGLSTWLNLGMTLGLAGGWIALMYRMSNRFGPYGLMKRWARVRLPRALSVSSRKSFMFS